MKREVLADEIRGAGNAVRFADGPVLVGRTVNRKMTILHSPQGKLGLPDEEIIRMAATCSTCDASASQFDIGFAADVADCYRSFARLIWPCIDHEDYCEAKPYLPVFEGAQKNFAKVKAEFEKRRQQLEQQLAARKTKKAAKKAVKKSKVAKKTVTKKKAAKKASKKTAKRVKRK